MLNEQGRFTLTEADASVAESISQLNGTRPMEEKYLESLSSEQIELISSDMEALKRLYTLKRGYPPLVN